MSRSLFPDARCLPREFFARDCRQVAPELLNKILVRGWRAGRIVEVEAYGGPDDPGSHGRRGRTPRNEVMFGPPGRLYIYFTYGMHWCANVVCGQDGECSAVLLRALHPLHGLPAMRRARPKAKKETQLCSGPARLCQALNLDGRHLGRDLTRVQGGLYIMDDGLPPPGRPGQTPRIGISEGKELPWRWYVKGDPHLSRPG